MLKKGLRQACSTNTCIKTGEIVGNGVYATPYFTSSLFEYTREAAGGYHLILQCRAKPSMIKMSTGTNHYWIINN